MYKLQPYVSREFCVVSFLKRLNVAAVLFYYDYLLTFAAEVSHIWPQPISVNTFLFFLNRYFSFLGNVAASLLLYAKLGNPEQVR